MSILAFSLAELQKDFSATFKLWQQNLANAMLLVKLNVLLEKLDQLVL